MGNVRLYIKMCGLKLNNKLNKLIKLNKYVDFLRLHVVGRSGKTQLQKGENLNKITLREKVYPLTAGAAYIRVVIFYQHIKYHILNMLMIKSISKIWKELTSILSNLNNFHSLEVVDRVSETQLQVRENSNWIIWRLNS